MKRHLSIWMLMARSTIYKVLGLFLALAAADGALFALALRQGASALGLEQVLTESHLPAVFGAGLVLLTVVLCLNGCEFSAKQGYTLRRLRVSQREIFLWQAVHNAMCYFLLLAVQTGIVLALCRYYVAHYQEMVAWYPDMVNDQTMLLAFYRVPFLHSLLPLADVWRYVRNAVLCAALGVCAAAFPAQQRQGNRGIAVVILTIPTAAFFAQQMASSDFGMIGAAVVITAVALFNVSEVLHETA